MGPAWPLGGRWAVALIIMQACANHRDGRVFRAELSCGGRCEDAAIADCRFRTLHAGPIRALGWLRRMSLARAASQPQRACAFRRNNGSHTIAPSLQSPSCLPSWDCSRPLPSSFFSFIYPFVYSSFIIHHSLLLLCHNYRSKLHTGLTNIPRNTCVSRTRDRPAPIHRHNARRPGGCRIA